MQLASIIRIEFSLYQFMHSALVSIRGSLSEFDVHVQLLSSWFQGERMEHIRFRSCNGQAELDEHIRQPFLSELVSRVNSEIQSRLRTAYPLRAV